MQENERTLTGRTIALPESRQLDILSRMLQKRGANVWRCPLVSILDTPHSGPVNEWLKLCIEQPFDYLILLTGEGLRRLLGFAHRAGTEQAFIDSLRSVRKLIRGPKPGQALREIQLKHELIAEQPTTDGVIQTLQSLDLKSCRIGVQLYGDNPNTKLIDYLSSRGAVIYSVAPYIYAPDSDELRVTELINELAAGNVDAVAFTSQPQLKRLLAVAQKNGQEELLKEALQATTIAAVGPVVAQAIRDAGLQVDVMPTSSFFMKPMVSSLVEALNA
jgi:uroporphyrinogen-III synthase